MNLTTICNSSIPPNFEEEDLHFSVLFCAKYSFDDYDLCSTYYYLQCRQWLLPHEYCENKVQNNKRLILLTKCSWRKVGLRERRSRGDSCRKVLLFGRKNAKKTFSLAFLKKILFQNTSWYTDIFASVPLHAPPLPCQYFLSVPLVVKQNRQMSSQLVSKASATANVLKSDNL